MNSLVCALFHRASRSYLMCGEMNNEQHVMPLLGPNVREIDRRYIIMSKGTKLVSLFSISLYVVQVRILLDCNITINRYAGNEIVFYEFD